METEIGPTLREARIRHKIDLTEIEERTKIRVRYLRALETEEWDVLPGPTYTRSFIRTYATFLGLDGERLADDYRRLEEDRMAEVAGPREPHPLPSRLAGAGGGPRFGPGVIGALIAVALVAVVLVLGLTSNSGNDKTNAGPNAGGAKAKQGKHQGTGRRSTSLRSRSSSPRQRRSGSARSRRTAPGSSTARCFPRGLRRARFVPASSTSRSATEGST